MKVKIFLILFLLLILIGILVFYIDYEHKIKEKEEKTLTIEKLEDFTIKDLEEFCDIYNYECNINYEYSFDIVENKLINANIENYSFVYSKGDFPITNHSLSFGAAGDVILYGSKNFKTGNTYNYDSIFKNMKEKISNYDIAAYTQETLPAGCDSGYPLFCSPYEIVDAGINAGFDIVATATNHSLDQWDSGLERSVLYYEESDITFIGTYKKDDIESLPKTIEKNGIKIGLLNYTDSLNGLSFKSGLEHTVKVFSNELLIKESEYLKSLDVDFIIAFMHWGPEYNTNPSTAQLDMAKALANASVDVTIGSHTHSVNPVDYVSNDDNTHSMLVAYSLGNFNAAQHAYIWDTAYGGMLEFNLNISVQNEKVIEKSINNVAFFPVFHETFNNGLIISPLKESRYSNKFDDICSIATKLTDVKCYN